MNLGRYNLKHAFAATWCLAVCLCASTLNAQFDIAEEDLPEPAQGIGVTEQLGKDLPLHLTFEDDQNRFIKLGQLFDGKRPVVLSFNYSNCPKLCVVQLQNLAAELQHIDLVPNRDFQIVSVSIDPTEQARTLANTKNKYVTAYGDLDTADGWHFLRGTKTNIGELTRACGFKYRYFVKERIYSHPAAFIFCTADGRISRYLNGLDGSLGKSMQPALVEAGKGRIGSLADKVKYFAGCFVFDPTTGKYSLSAIKAMRLAGLATVVCLVVGITPYWIRRRNPNPKQQPQDSHTESKPLKSELQS